MREIKFRGLAWDSNEWVYGYLTKKDGSFYINGVFVQADTIGQYIGLKDKNGIDIYEGDIVHSSVSNNAAPIIFSEGNFGRELTKGVSSFIPYSRDYTVMGNIHNQAPINETDPITQSTEREVNNG